MSVPSTVAAAGPDASAARAFLDRERPPTPVLVVDVDIVRARLAELRRVIGHHLLYAVKANPAPPVLRAVVDAGGGFDVASPAEIDLTLAAGADPSDISYGNPVKKAIDIVYAHTRGVRRFVTDSAADVDVIATHAPGAAVTVRLLPQTPDSVTTFGSKFGVTADTAVDLLLRAADRGLDAAGVGFHVGSQQCHPDAWATGVAAASGVAEAAGRHGVRPRLLNLGGGFATGYTTPVPPLADYADSIARALADTSFTEVCYEPGRAVVADAGVIRTEVVLVAPRPDGRRWVYLDAGRYSGLAETENEAIAYRLDVVGRADAATDGPAGSDGPVVIAGPTCDGDDVLYQRTPYHLPLDLRAGELVDILSTGAYTASYGSVAFNGFAPPATICITDGRPIDD